MSKKRKSKRNKGGSPSPDMDFAGLLGDGFGPNGPSMEEVRELIEQNPEILRSLLDMLGEHADELFDPAALIDQSYESRPDWSSRPAGMSRHLGFSGEDRSQIEALFAAAQNAESKDEAREYVEQALALSPDDPSVLLWMHQLAPSTSEAVRYMNLAVDAELREYGVDPKRPVALRDTGYNSLQHLLDILNLRAEYLWTAGRKEESLSYFRQLLIWDSKDASDVRSRLLPKLLTLGEFVEARELLRRMKASSTDVRYATALMSYHDEGSSAAAREALRKAAKKNLTLAKFLAGAMSVPEDHEELVNLDMSEAGGAVGLAIGLYVDWMPAWRTIPGAIAWMRRELKLTPSPDLAQEDPAADRDAVMDDLLRHAPDESARDELRESFARMSRTLDIKAKLAPADTDLALLPQNSGEVWEVDLRLMSQWLVENGESFLGYMFVIVDLSSGEMVGGETIIGAEPPEVLRLLAANMMCPAGGEPRRPAVIRALPKRQFATFADACAKLGITWNTVEHLDVAPDIWSDLEAATGEADSPSFPLSQSPGVALEQFHSLYAAAADFYRQTPWRRIPRDEQFRLDCADLDDEPWCLVVFGDGGSQLGLALCDGVEAREALEVGEPPDISALNSSLSIAFHIRSDCNPTDVVFATEANLPIATCDAWPEVLRVEEPDVVRYPHDVELRLLEAALRAVPLFCANPESESFEVTVPAYGGDLTLKITRLART